MKILPGGSVKLLYCGPFPAGTAPRNHPGDCDAVAELVVADSTNQLQQDGHFEEIYHTSYFRPSKAGVYAFKIDGLRIRKKGQAAVVINDHLFICGEDFDCIQKLKVFP
ncbi:MAG: hypothetical protein U1E83_10605 [Methylotetracoccus sp.]